MVAPKQTFTRPPLPLSYANQVLAIDSGVLPSVKFQVITRELQDIIVGRVKIETPSGHAFILRRFDTGSLSLTTMFRAAFPDAPEEAEKMEALYVKNAFEAPGTSGVPSGRLRLAGTWITPQCAEAIASDYNLKDMIAALIKAKPDPGAIYRRSTKPGSGDSPSATAVGSPPPATTTARRSDAAPSPAGVTNKRQRVSSPHQEQPAATILNSRQSNRLKSPARATPPRTSPRTVGRTPARGTPTRSTPARPSRGSVAATVTPMVLDEDEEPEIGGQDADEGLAEGKAIFEEVAASYTAPASAMKSARKRTAVEQSTDDTAPALPTMLNLDGPGLQVARPIASNRRINFELNAEQKALAWGTLAFAFGMGVTSFLLPMLS